MGFGFTWINEFLALLKALQVALVVHILPAWKSTFAR